MSKQQDSMREQLESRFGGSRVDRSRTGELSMVVAPDELVELCAVLRDDEAFGFEQLMDVCGVDYLSYGQDEWVKDASTRTGFSRAALRELPEKAPEGRSRFAVVYHLLSLARNQRLRLKVYCEDDEHPRVPSVTGIWDSADWFEREAFDLYGILFDGHPDLRRILTDYGFIGHPFRKDFPLIGEVEVRYDPEKARVIYQPVSIQPRTLVPKVIRQEDHRYRDEIHTPSHFQSEEKAGDA